MTSNASVFSYCRNDSSIYQQFIGITMKISFATLVV